jgi:hypothetical protein
MTSIEIPNANPSVITNGFKTKDADHKEPELKSNGNGHANGHSTSNDDIEFTSDIVKESLAYSGRGRPLRV